MSFSYEKMINNLIKRVAKKAYIAGYHIGWNEKMREEKGFFPDVEEEAWEEYKKENL
jgi:hypothetical protein